MTKPTKWHVRPAKTQISLGIHPVWSASSQCAQWVAEDPVFLHADSEGADQTGRMPRLIWIFAGRTDHFVGFVMRWLVCLSKHYNKQITTLDCSSSLLTLSVLVANSRSGSIFFPQEHMRTCFPSLSPILQYSPEIRTTVNFLNIRTPKSFIVITLKFELCGSTIE